MTANLLQPQLLYRVGLMLVSRNHWRRMMLFEDSYSKMTRLLMEVADEICNGRLLLTHEGGYNPDTTPFLGLAMIKTLSRC